MTAQEQKVKFLVNQGYVPYVSFNPDSNTSIASALNEIETQRHKEEVEIEYWERIRQNDNWGMY